MTTADAVPAAPDQDGRPLLLVIGTGGRDYREYLLRSIATRYRLHLFLAAEPDWEREYAAGWSVLAGMAGTIDATEMIEAARELAGREPVAGVLSWDEARVLQSAKVAAALGLPGGDPDMIMRCRDKHLTREALGAAGVPQAASVLVPGPAEALAAAGQIGYPVVLKPRAMAASLGAVRVDTPAELTGQFAFARDTTLPGAWRYEVSVLVEEYLTGTEISVDAAVHHGEALAMFVARKDVGYPPYFEEMGHLVDGADPLLSDPELLAVVQAAHTALGYTDGMTHTELKLTPAGPKIIEVNARLGGDLIPYLGMRVTGIDPGLAAAAVACGQRPDLTACRALAGAVRFFYVEHDDTVIGSIDFGGGPLPPAVDRAAAMAGPGDVVSPPPRGTFLGRVAFATAVAPAAAQCLAALDAAQAALRVRPAGQPAAAGQDRTAAAAADMHGLRTGKAAR
ncbi:MAG TPA: ATP-grasp domain-containing protein [Streptosporangiaceae bacterium]|jgi:biotin carboxylase